MMYNNLNLCNIADLRIGILKGDVIINKNFRSLILFFVICLSLSSCARYNNSESVSESTGTQVQNEETTQPPFIIEGGGVIGGDADFDFNQTTEEYVEDDPIYLQIKEGLNNLGMNYAEIPVTADLIGAEKAVRYQFDDNTLIEIYKFDENSDTFKKVKENKEITIEGAGSAPVDEVSENLALYIEGDIKNKDEIIKLFESVKNE